jgi:predicted phosphodiesterase
LKARKNRLIIRLFKDDLRGISLALVLSIGCTNVCSAQTELAFVSDTQAPMWMETIVLKPNDNVKATGLVFRDIIRQKPAGLFILGDVVKLGYKPKKWKGIDAWLDSCRKAGIPVSAVLGNHDVMRRAHKGESQFQQRFPDHHRTGYFRILDSMAIVFLNSNFKKLSAVDRETQQEWFRQTLSALDDNIEVKVIIVTCHHAPYSNSTIVGSSEEVQKHFVPAFTRSRKARLFLTGHSHNFERFNHEGKDFVVIGGGGGLSQPVSNKKNRLNDLAGSYKPQFHYLLVKRSGGQLKLTSRFLKPDFSGFAEGQTFQISIN